MINLIQSLSVGNALRLFITPPASAVYWRVLRRTQDLFTGPDDAGAVLVDEGNDNVLLDATGLVNGMPYFYRAYYWDGAAWSGSATVSATPVATYDDPSVDVLSTVRERVLDGLAIEVQRGHLKLPPNKAQIDVINALPMYDDSAFPVVTVHLESESPAVRSIGEELGEDEETDAGWEENEGWLARAMINIVGWSLNSDERIALRIALRRILVANLGVFNDLGLQQVEFDVMDNEDVQSYPAPVYQAMCRFTCLVAVSVTSAQPKITDVQVTLK